MNPLFVFNLKYRSYISLNKYVPLYLRISSLYMSTGAICYVLRYKLESIVLKSLHPSNNARALVLPQLLRGVVRTSREKQLFHNSF